MFGSTWGQNNQQKPGGLFGSGTSGGFGQSSGGFGQQQNTGGFGQQQQQQNTGGGLFGSTTNQTSGFGSGGFGQQNTQQTSTFGARPTFGATGSSPFGGTSTNTGGGLFGSNNNNTSTFGSNTGATSSFGNNSASSGGLFGSKPATGFGSTSTGGLFGQPQTSTFGASQNAAGPSNQVHNYVPGPLPPCPQTGTAAPPYQPTWQRDPSGPLNKDPLPPHLFHVITAMDAYKGGSFEELRMLDYQQNRKEPTAQPAAATGGFGQATGTTGGFGSTGSTFGQPAQQSTGFGAAKPAGGLFGSTSGTTSGFGNTSGGFGTSSGGFGQQNNTGSVFGQQQNTTGGFGQAANTNTGGGLFGQQQNNTTSGGLFGSGNNTTSGFGQNNQQQGTTSGFGGFGAKPAFGSTSTTTTGFGQTNNATGFGQSNTGSTGFGFGQQNQQQQQPPQQSTGGLFGNTTTNAFGQNNTQQNNTLGGGTSLFGQNNQQQTNTTGGLFGNTANKPAGGLFGTTPAATTGTTGGFGGFGQNNTTTTTQPATGGLFGNTAAATTGTTGGGLFGNTNTTTTQPAATGGLFGNTNNTATAGGGLFGAKPATTTGGLFGSTTTTQPATTSTGFGGFGQQQNTTTTGGGLFGNTAANNQTQAKPAGSLFGGGSSLFGAQNNQQATQPAAGGSLFGGLNQSQPAATGGLFGSTASTAQPAAGQTGGLFGSTLGQSTAQQPSLTASVDQNPYGKNELFAYSGQKLEVGSTNKKPALPPLTASSYRVTPSKGRVVKLRGFASPLNVSQSSGRASSPSLASPSRSVIGSPAPSDRYNGLTDAALSPNAFIPRPNVKKITVTPKANTVNSEDPLESVLGKSQLRGSVNGNGTPATPDQGSKSPTLSISNGRALVGDETPTRRSQPIAQESIRAVTAERPLKRGDYWCRPKLEKLRGLSHQELSKLENFTVGRKGYGEVTFLDPVDLTDLPSLQDLFGKTVIVEDLELTVYPDDTNKPPRGQGLNVPAQISLENCFARDKATRQPITDPNDARYRRQIKRVKAVQGTEFVSFSDDGVWTFTVEHFSRYGLADSDDEESDEGMNDSSSTGKGKSSPESMIAEETESEEDDFLPPTRSMHDPDVDMDHDSGLEETGDSYDEMDEEEEEESSSERGWEDPLTKKLGRSGIRRVRLQQANYFGNQEVKAPSLSAAEADRTRAKQALEVARAAERKRIETGFGEAEEDMNELDDRAVKRASFGELASPPPRQPRKYAKVPLADSTVNGNEAVRPDAGLALGRSFRCSWGPNGELVHFGKICAPKTEYQSPSDATVFLQQVDLLADSPEIERPKADRLLSLLLDNSQVEHVDGTPMAMTSTEIRFKEFARLFDEGDRSHEATIWRLGKALFDEVDLRLPANTPDDVRERVFQVRRKLALSKWLEDAVAPAVDGDLAAAGDNRPAKLFSLLTGNQTDRAVQSALDGKDMRLATLVSQAGGPEVFRSEVLRQLDDWTKFKANSVIGYDYRRLYALLAGITDVSKGDSSRGADAAPDVLVAEGLDWKRAFGLYLWHGCPFEETIGQVFEAYTHSLDDAHPPAKPIPPYLEKPDGEREWNMATKPTDVLYNMIRMFVDLTVPLDDVLSARSCSPSPTDLRLPWHLYLLLAHALEARDFSDREEPNADGVAFSASANDLTRSYAAQLEEEGQWTWAAFVLLHLELPEARRSAVRELLFRHPNPNDSERTFLVNTLKVPPAWLHEAKAAEFATENDPYREYFELIRAGLADRAQRLLITKLAPEAILRDSQSLLRRLCEALEPLHPTGWEYGGKLFLDYLNIINDTKPLLASVLRAGSHPDPVEEAELNRLCKSVPRVIQLLPALFPNKEDVQQVASLSEMLSNLQNLGAVLHMNNRIERPPISDLLVDKDRLHLLQGAATESFERSLSAIMA